ncbi:MAG: hypothetical protein PHO63_05040 [Bacilli bacterium]|nr:hypothetical protein [Bacilli bacterium]MDD4809124.1 hypothetical protein [Bacilli bacterium]
MKRLMIDIDDTICTDGIFKLTNDFLDEDMKLEKSKSYYIQDHIPKDRLDDFHDYFFHHNVYDYSELKEDAVEVIEKLSHEYEIFIVSSYLLKGESKRSPLLVPRKHEWLLKTLPFIDPTHFVFTSSKHIIDCDIKIDDLVKNLQGNASLKLLFTSFHNEEYSDEELEKEGIRRVNSWKEIEKILLNQENNR